MAGGHDPRADQSRQTFNQLDLSGYTENDPCSCELLNVKISGEGSQEKVATVEIKNIGSVSWPEEQREDKIKLGCKLLENLEGCHRTIKEFRADVLRPIAPNESAELTIKLELDGLLPGSYLCEFDMVNEGSFWFSERGSKPVIKEIKVI